MASIAGLVRLLGIGQASRLALARVRRSRTPLAVRLASLPHPVYLRADGTDVNCFWQIFGRRDCDIDVRRPPRTIIHGGAHIGLASIYLANRFPRATIIAVEPERSNYELAKRNVAPYPNVHVVRGGIWCRDAWLDIENPDADTWAYRVREVAGPGAGAFRGHSIDGLLRRFDLDGVDLVKLDIEGAETELFSRGSLRWLDRIEALIIELHGQRAPQIVGGAMSALGLVHSRRGEKVVFVRDRRPQRARAPSLTGP